MHASVFGVCLFDVCLSVHYFTCVGKKTQLDATEWFIALVISTCFGPIIRRSRLYLCYCHIWCVMPWLLVVGGQVQGNRLCVRDEESCSSSFPHPERIACCSAPSSRPPTTKALHTISGNNTSIVSSSWWWAFKCPKHVEQITSAINHSVASSWFSSLRMYNVIIRNAINLLQKLFGHFPYFRETFGLMCTRQ